METLSSTDWIYLGLGAFLVGMAKTSIAGLGGLTVSIFANIIPPRESTGVLLPLLICADILAVKMYSKEAVWGHILKITPWTLLGILIGFLIMDHLTDLQVKKTIGLILLTLTFIHILSKKNSSKINKIEQNPLPLPWLISLGVFAGIATMIANAAGPVIVIYLLSLRLKKMPFQGTNAWFFFLLNTAKVPFSYSLGLIHLTSLKLDLFLVPLVILGSLGGRLIITKIHQKTFEFLALGFTILAGLKLIM